MAAEQRIEGDRTGDAWRCRDDGIELADRPRQNAGQREKHEDQNQAEPEVRDRPRQHAIAEQHTIGDASFLDGGVDPDGDAQRHGDEARQEDQLEGGGQALLDVLDHRLRAAPGVAEIALEHVRHVTRVLLVDGLVQSHGGAQILDALLGRELPGHEIGRIARQEPDQEEDDDRDDKQLWDEKDQSPASVLYEPHVVSHNARGSSAYSAASIRGSSRLDRPRCLRWPKCCAARWVSSPVSVV